MDCIDLIFALMDESVSFEDFLDIAAQIGLSEEEVDGIIDEFLQND